MKMNLRKSKIRVGVAKQVANALRSYGQPIALSLPILFQFISPVIAAAATVPVSLNASSVHHSATNNVSLHQPLVGTGNSPSKSTQSATNLDLSSVLDSLSARNTSPLSILVGGTLVRGAVTGGTAMSISPGQLVTPAEFAAVNETLHGAQTLLLGAQGTALGGSIRLNSSYTQNLSSLVVPANVTLDAIGYSAHSPLNVTGNTEIFGSIYSVQTAPHTSSDLNFGNLTIESGALLSGSLPANLSGQHLFASSGMTLNSVGNFLNQGTLKTPGTLTVSAGGNIVNQSVSNNQALISAQNINLLTGSGNVANSGLIQASSVLNVNTLSPTTNLTVNNAGGVLQATGGGNPLLGVINFRADGADLEKADVSITGGALIANGGVNVFGKDMVVAVDSVTGPLSNKGSVAHDSVLFGNLVLGQQILSGDPTYYNNAGDITLSSLTSVGGDIAIVASGNINTTSDTTIQTTADDNSIFLSAGLNFDIAAGANVSDTSGSGDTTTKITFTGTSNPGMNINAAGNQLNLTATGAGNVTLVATGTISTGSGTFRTDSGNVLAIAANGFNGNGGTIRSTTEM